MGRTWVKEHLVTNPKTGEKSLRSGHERAVGDGVAPPPAASPEMLAAMLGDDLANVPSTDPAADIDAMTARFKALGLPDTQTGDPTLGMNLELINERPGKDREKQKAKTNAVLEELENAVLSMQHSANFLRLLDFRSRFHNYSLNNLMLIMAQKPDATYVKGYKGWPQLGRHVNKGTKGIMILRPMFITERDKDGKPVLDKNGNEKTFILYKPAYVYDISDTDGEPLPEEPVKHLSGDAPAGFQEKLEEAITAQGYQIRRKPLPLGVNGATDPINKVVTISDALSPAQAAKTTAHELGHILSGHADNMDDYHTGHGGCRGKYELHAESFAAVVCRDAGMNTSDYSVGYIATWGHLQSGDAAKEMRKELNVIIKATGDYFAFAEKGTVVAE